MVGLSAVLLVVMGIVGYIQFSKPDVVKAAAATPYTETWAAIDSMYTSPHRGADWADGGNYVVWHSGMPPDNVAICALVGAASSTQPSTSHNGSCSMVVTKWSVTGTVGP